MVVLSPSYDLVLDRSQGKKEDNCQLSSCERGATLNQEFLWHSMGDMGNLYAVEVTLRADCCILATVRV